MSAPSPTTNEDAASFSLGQRVCDAANCTFRATVRFVGTVDGTKGEWIGVEWDDDHRGKHDGSHGGKRYFQTESKSDKCASFVRPKKISAGVALGKAVKDRYGQVEGEMAGVEQDVLDGLQREINAPFLQVVGFDKVNRVQSDFGHLRIVSVRELAVHGTDNDQLHSWLPQVRELNLADNLLWKWEQVAQVGAQLKLLTAVNLAGNRFCDAPHPEKLSDAFCNLRSVVLNDLGYDWPQLLKVASHLPRLEVLHVADNKISHVDELPEGALQGLIELDLSENPVKDWSSVLAFRKLPNLKRLTANKCGLAKIHFDGVYDEEHCFDSLRVFQFTHNELSDWQSLSALHRLQITDVRVRVNPVLETEDGETCR